MRKNKIKQMMMDGKPVINGWVQVPSTVSAEVMAHEGMEAHARNGDIRLKKYGYSK